MDLHGKVIQLLLRTMDRLSTYLHAVHDQEPLATATAWEMAELLEIVNSDQELLFRVINELNLRTEAIDETSTGFKFNWLSQGGTEIAFRMAVSPGLVSVMYGRVDVTGHGFSYDIPKIMGH